MIDFSNLTPEEFVHLNKDEIHPKLLAMLDQYSETVAMLKLQLEEERRNSELAEEQVGFAVDLIESLDKFAEVNLSKAKLKEYTRLRENTYFET